MGYCMRIVKFSMHGVAHEVDRRLFHTLDNAGCYTFRFDNDLFYNTIEFSPHFHSVFTAGLMADELGSYAPAFYASGAVTLLGASFIFVTKCACVPKNHWDHEEHKPFTGTETLVVERETVL